MKGSYIALLAAALIMGAGCRKSNETTEHDEIASNADPELHGIWTFTTGRSDSIVVKGEKIGLEYLTEGTLTLDARDHTYDLALTTTLVSPGYLPHAMDASYSGTWRADPMSLYFTSKGGDSAMRMTAIEEYIPLNVWESTVKNYSDHFEEEILQLRSDKMVTIDERDDKTYYRKSE